jgi:hypothetical protein
VYSNDEYTDREDEDEAVVNREEKIRKKKRIRS